MHELMQPQINDRPVEVIVNEDSVLLIAPDGLCLAVTPRAAELTLARLARALGRNPSAAEPGDGVMRTGCV